MEAFLLQFMNVSIQVGVVTGIVLLVRLIFHLAKLPKRYSYFLWVIPFFRMICPWQLESPFSILPQDVNRLGSKFVGNATDYVQGTSAIVTDDSLGGIITDGAGETGTIIQMGVILLFAVWLVGVLLFVTHGMVSYWKLKKELVCSVRMKNNIYFSDGAKTPLVFGIFCPKIYLPSDIRAHESEYVIAHEQTHIRRKDHIIKLLGYFVACIYWFHPLVWIAYLGMGKDMEMSCDEEVMKQFGESCRSEYATVLLELTVGRGRLAGVWLAFGEGDTKMRITNIMKYKKPVVYGAVVAILALIVLAVGLLTNPDTDDALAEGKEELVATETETETEIYVGIENTEVSNSSEEEKPQPSSEKFNTEVNVSTEENVTEEYPVEEQEDVSLSDGENHQVVPSIEGENLSNESDGINEISEISEQEEQQSKDEEVKKDIIDKQDAQSNLYGMKIIDGTLTASGAMVHIWNDSAYELSYGSDYFLKYLDGEEWKDVPYLIDNAAFTSEARLVDEDGVDEKVGWGWLYGDLSPGTYLLTKSALIRTNRNPADPYESAELGVMFTIE